MAANALTMTDMAIPQRTLRQWLNIYYKEARNEFLKYLRLPIFSISTTVFPVMFYVLFGIVLANGNPVQRAQGATYLLATMSVYGVMGIAMFSFGVGVAVERGQGWMLVKRASPMPLPAYFFAKLANSVLFTVFISLALVLVGEVFGGVRLTVWQGTKLISLLVAGSVPFCAMGLALGYFAKPNSAPAMVNLIYLPMAFCSGLWIPLFLLPKFFQKLALALPPYHVSQLTLNAVGANPHPTPLWPHAQVLIGVTLLFLGLGAYGYWRDEGQTYG